MDTFDGRADGWTVRTPASQAFCQGVIRGADRAAKDTEFLHDASSDSGVAFIGARRLQRHASDDMWIYTTRGASHFVAQSCLFVCSYMVPASQFSPMLGLTTSAKPVYASVTPLNCVPANHVVPSAALVTTTWGPVRHFRPASTVAVTTPPPTAPPVRDGWRSAWCGWSWRSIASLTLRPSASLLPPMILLLLHLLVLLPICLNAYTLPSLPDALHLCPDAPDLHSLP